MAQDFLLIPRSALTSWNSAQTIDGGIAWCLLSSSCTGACTRLPVSTSLIRRSRLVHCVLVAAPECRSSHWARPRPSPQCGSHLRVRLTVRACRCPRDRPMVGDLQSMQGGFDACQNNYFWCWKEVQVLSNCHLQHTRQTSASISLCFRYKTSRQSESCFVTTSLRPHPWSDGPRVRPGYYRENPSWFHCYCWMMD